MRWLISAAIILAPMAASGQNALNGADSALVGRILTAEETRNGADAAIAQGLRHADPRIRTIAERAAGRIADPAFPARTALPAVPPARAWPEPAWRLRYRGLTERRDDCGALRTALADSTWPVRLRAADLAMASCAADDALVATLRSWVDDLPRDASRRAPGGVSWHPAAHAIVALARVRPADARSRIGALASHADSHVRMYAARAAAILQDTVRLRALARDSDDNVKEAAIAALSRLSGHTDDSIYLTALRANGAQVVRAAASALRGSTHADARAAITAAFETWVGKQNASARDVRVALLQASGRTAGDDRPPAASPALAPRAVALALGADIRLRVTLSPASGGGSFVVRLRGDVAPIMAARVLALAQAKYYDGLTWHRVEADFVIQGGSPGANEYAGYTRYFRDELGTLSHARGTIGMSTRGHDTGDGQWFVNLRDNARLDPEYTVFGEVIDGIEVVDGVLEGDVIASIEEVPR